MKSDLVLMDSDVKIRSAADRTLFDLLGARFHVAVRTEETDGAFCILEMDVPPGAGVPLHHHPYPEVFYILEGRIDFARVQDEKEQWIATGEGETVLVPSNAPHGLLNRYAKPSRLLVVVTARHQAFFEAAGTAVETTQPPSPPEQQDLERVVQIAAQHAMFVD